MEKEKTTWCYGCTFEIGSLIIGSLEMISGLICFVIGLFFIILYFINVHSRYDRNADMTPHIISGSLLAGGAVSIAHAAILIHGTRKGRQGFLQCWIILQIIGLVLSTIGVIVAAILRTILVTIIYAVGYQAISGVVSIALGIFFVLVVKSHRQELLDYKNDESNGKAFNEMGNISNMYPTDISDQKV